MGDRHERCEKSDKRQETRYERQKMRDERQDTRDERREMGKGGDRRWETADEVERLEK